MPRRPWAAKFVAPALLASCSHQALLVRTDGTQLRAEIKRSDASFVEVRTLQGEVLLISREAIRSVDHPGMTAKVGGGVLLGYGILSGLAIAPEMAVAEFGHARGNDPALPVGLVLGLLATAEIIGAILIIRHGNLLERQSRAALEPGPIPLSELPTRTNQAP